MKIHCEVSKLKIISNIKSKSLKLINKPSELHSDYEEVGPYRAMYDYKFRSHTWVNWASKSEPSLTSIREIVKDPDWEEYIFSIIVKEGTSDDQVDKIIKKLGYMPDYILERNYGKVTLLHQTNHIKQLIENGYHSNQASDSYSFGKGLYCLDKGNFNDVNDGWINLENVYTGSYHGEYLRCTEDIDTGGKSGHNNKHEQEIVIPFNEIEIEWIV